MYIYFFRFSIYTRPHKLHSFYYHRVKVKAVCLSDECWMSESETHAKGKAEAIKKAIPKEILSLPKKGLTRSLTVLLAPTTPLGKVSDPSVRPSKSSDNRQAAQDGWTRTTFHFT